MAGEEEVQGGGGAGERESGGGLGSVGVLVVTVGKPRVNEREHVENEREEASDVPNFDLATKTDVHKEPSVPRPAFLSRNVNAYTPGRVSSTAATIRRRRVLQQKRENAKKKNDDIRQGMLPNRSPLYTLPPGSPPTVSYVESSSFHAILQRAGAQLTKRTWFSSPFSVWRCCTRYSSRRKVSTPL